MIRPGHCRDHPSRQSRGLGTLLLKDLIDRAASPEVRALTLNARTTATRLYAKQGFVPEGEVFLSDSTGVAHVKMTYRY